MTFDEAAEALDRMAEELPEVFFDELPGGIVLETEAKWDPQFPEGEVYFMGEYIYTPGLGPSISIYYGSFLESAKNEDWTEEDWLDELWITLKHELTHHMEYRANTHGLDDKDDLELMELKEEYGCGE